MVHLFVSLPIPLHPRCTCMHIVHVLVPVRRAWVCTLYVAAQLYTLSLDIHLATKGLQGWPKLYFQVWHEDYFGRHELCEWTQC